MFLIFDKIFLFGDLVKEAICIFGTVFVFCSIIAFFVALFIKIVIFIGDLFKL